MKTVVVYVRVSSVGQNLDSQIPDLERWVRVYAEGEDVAWFCDKTSGTKMQRPGWSQVETGIRSGLVRKVVVWRLDRLGRTAAGLTTLFEELQQRGVDLISVREGLDLSTPAGRMMAGVLASVAQYETEVRRERQAAGIAAAKAAGKQWGGSKPGRRLRVTEEKERAVRQLLGAGVGVSETARTVELSRTTVYKIKGGA